MTTPRGATPHRLFAGGPLRRFMLVAVALVAGAVTSVLAPASASFATTAATTSLIVDNASPTVGQTVTFTATVAGPTSGATPTGTVTFYDGSNPIACTGGSQTLSGTTNSATATCQDAFSTASATAHAITADYVPGADPNYTAGSASNSVSVTVGQDSTTAAVSELPTTVTAPSESTVVFTVAVTPGVAANQALVAGETVTINLGTTTALSLTSCVATLLASGAGTCRISNNALPPGGPYVVWATYLGDPNLSASALATATPGLSVTGVQNQSAVSLQTSSATYDAGNPTLALVGTGGSGTGAFSFPLSGNDPGSAGCSVIGSTLHYQSAGSCTIDVTHAGDANYRTQINQVTVTIGSDNASQGAVSLSSLSTSFGAGAVTLIGSGGAGTGGFSFALNNAGSAGCSVSGSALSYSNAGNCAVNVTRNGDSIYASQSNTVTFTVTPGSQSPVSLESTPVTYGTSSATFPLVGTGGSGTGAFSYSLASSGSAGCSVSGSTLRFVHVGSCVVQVQRAGDANFQSQSNAVTVTFTKAPGVAAATRVRLTRPAPTTNGQRVLVHGRLETVKGGKGARGVEVKATYDPLGGRAWHGVAKTGAGGAFSFHVPATTNGRLRIAAQANANLLASTITVSVGVLAAPRCGGPTRSVKVGSVVPYICAVPDLPAGVSFSVQFQSGRSWTTLFSSVSTAGALLFHIDAKGAGTYPLRIELARNSRYLATTAGLGRLIVH